MNSIDSASSASWIRTVTSACGRVVLVYAMLIGLTISHVPVSVHAAAPTRRPSVITGEVTYLERLALPAGAVLQVRLLDVLEDAPAVVVAERTIKPTGNVPIRFELRFDPKRIKPTHTYVVNARLTAGPREWITITPHPVLTNGAPATVSIELH